MSMETRKNPRLREWDYASNGAYFVTVCSKNRQCLLSTVVGRGALTPPMVKLSDSGEVLDKYIKNINFVYEDVSVDKYIIMPNHFHMLLSINDKEKAHGGMRASRPTVSTIIRSLKTMVTREIGKNIFQASFYDHIIRDEQDYLIHWQYIDDNPAKWAEDEYF